MAAQSHPVFARDGSPIPAGVDANPSPNAVSLAEQQVGSVLLAAVRRLQPPTGQYNCHGLVFASRRANIPPVGVDVDVDALLVKDGFVRLPNGPAPQVGDVVAYRTDKGEVEHTGFVSRVELLGNTPVVWVWSAWGGLGEFEHKPRDCVYKGTPEYWRLRCPS